MARSIWSGAISFGLVNIPIRVYPASEEHALEFDMLHKKDLSPIRYAKVCKEEEKEIPYEEIVKGFEYEKGQYVVIEKEDFEKANVKKTKTIDIQHFTLINSIDPIFFEKPYYLEPDKKAEKAYALLREALKKSKKVAIANFVFRNLEHIGVLQPYGDVLLLIQLRYQTEIRPFKDLNLPKGKINPKEIDIALKLVDQLTEPFHPEKYKDTYAEELAETIAAKVKGKKPARKAKSSKVTPAGDLMHLLKASLGKSLGETKKPSPKKPHVIKSPPSKRPRKRKS